MALPDDPDDPARAPEDLGKANIVTGISLADLSEEFRTEVQQSYDDIQIL